MEYNPYLWVSFCMDAEQVFCYSPHNHDFRVKNGTASKPSQKCEPSTYTSTDGSSFTSYIVNMGALAGIVTSNKYSTKAVLGDYKRNAADSDLSALMADLRTAWGLN